MKWVRDQLDGAGYGAVTGERRTVREMVELLFLQLDSIKWLSDSERRDAIDIFTKLAKGYAIASDDVQNRRGNWIQFLLGDQPVGVTVRVKNNAYEGAAGEMHNGMIGKLVAARNRQAVVQYANSSEGTGHRHSPDILEVLVP